MNVIQRLNTKTVTGDEQLTFASIPDRESEHAAHVFNTIASVFLVEVEDRLRIAVILKLMSAFDEFVAIVGVVVNFAVVDDHARAVAIEHRLRSVRNIYDAQTPMAKADIAIHENTAVIRPPMMQNVAHLHEFCFIYLPVGAWGKDYAV